MNEKERERFIFELRMKEIESIDRDTSKLFMTLLVGAFVVLGFAYNNELLSVLDRSLGIFGGTKTLLTMSLLILIVFAIFERKNCHRISRAYQDLFFAIKENKLKEHKIKLYKFSDWLKCDKRVK